MPNYKTLKIKFLWNVSKIGAKLPSNYVKKPIKFNFKILISYENGVNVGGDLFVATVVKGDITGTGEIDVTDISLMQEQLVETTELKCAYKEAADFNSDKSIDVVDLSEMQEYIVNN